MIGNDTPTRPSQIPVPTTSPEFQNAHSDFDEVLHLSLTCFTLPLAWSVWPSARIGRGVVHRSHRRRTTVGRAVGPAAGRAAATSGTTIDSTRPDTPMTSGQGWVHRR